MLYCFYLFISPLQIDKYRDIEWIGAWMENLRDMANMRYFARLSWFLNTF